MTDKPIMIDGIKFTENFDIICQTCTRNNPCFQQCNQVYKEIIKYLFNNLQRKTAELDKIEEVIAPYQEPLEADAFSLSGAIKSILQRKTAECEELKKALAIKTDKDYINEIQDIQMKYECHQKSLGMCWWGKYGKETECIGIRECHKKELEVIKNLEHKLQKATEALDLILNGYGNDELDLENDYNPIRIADEALEQLESEEK